VLLQLLLLPLLPLLSSPLLLLPLLLLPLLLLQHSCRPAAAVRTAALQVTMVAVHLGSAAACTAVAAAALMR
jgi:hypothetical protein